MMKYENGLLRIEDLNPELKTQWRMSRAEMAILALKCFLAALKP
jgi:hypothetical protein